MKKEVKVIKLKEIDLQTKDVLKIKNLDDFLYLAGNDIVFQFNKCYYLICDTFVYWYELPR